MNLNLASLFVRHPRQPLQHVVFDTLPMRATDGQFSASPKTIGRRHRAASVKAQLGVYVARTTDSERRAAMERFLACKAIEQALLPEADIERKGR